MSKLVRITMVTVLVLAVLVSAVAGGAGVVDKKKKLACKKLLKPAQIEAIVAAPVALTYEGGDSNSVAGKGQNSVACRWTNDVGDEVSLSVYITDRVDQFEFTRDTPVGGGSVEPVTGVGQEAFFQLSATGDAVSIWAIAKRASFSLANINIDKDQPTLRTEQTELAKLVAKRLK